VSILNAQVKKMEAVDCAQLAGDTEGFSGADLRAIVSEAQLAAVMAHLEKLKAAEAAGMPHDNHATQEAPALSAAVRFPALHLVSVEIEIYSILYIQVLCKPERLVHL
jgi:SpoVK/Ycf46/Vps4 family AAA+-type ATPase